MGTNSIHSTGSDPGLSLLTPKWLSRRRKLWDLNLCLMGSECARFSNALQGSSVRCRPSLWPQMPSHFPPSWLCNQQPLHTSLRGREELTADEEKD